LNVASAASRCDLVDDHGGQAPPGIARVASMAGHRRENFAGVRFKTVRARAGPQRRDDVGHRSQRSATKCHLASVADQKQEDQLSVGHAINVRGWARAVNFSDLLMA
jgi:hypothetical protein